MKKQRIIPHSISGAFVFLLLGLFALFTVVTVLLGAAAYRRITERSGTDSAGRIATAYVRSMLRAKDEAGALRIGEEDGICFLSLKSHYDDGDYRTRIYVYDGMLRELFTADEGDFEPGNGEPVCEAEDLSASMDGDLLTVRILTDGLWHEIACAMHRTAEVDAA